MHVDEVEELGHEPAQAPHGRTVTAAVLAAALVVAWFVAGHHGNSRDHDLALPAPSVPYVAPTPAPANPRPQFEGVCTPVTDGRHRLSLSFVLANRTPTYLLVSRVQPLLPAGRLRARDVSINQGGCDAMTAPVPLLPGGAEVRVTFDLELPRQCPQPYPVSALVTTRVFESDGSGTTVEVPVYPDLGSIDFATCH